MANKRILIIDDYQAETDLMSYLLRKASVDVVTARSCTEAIILARDVARFHLVICDLRMPDVDGYECGERMRGELRLRDVPKILLTGGEMNPGDQAKARDAGYAACLVKTSNTDHLVEKLLSFMQP